MQRFHFISIGGAVMHNMALDMQKKGYIITGSDDDIFEPAKSRLQKAGLLPEKFGWFDDHITADLDGIILGMHARADNPELLKAKSLNIPVYSFPEFIYKESVNKQRIMIGGSHGKTTSTAMLMHIYKTLGRDFDYMVGSQIDGFETMVKLTDSAKEIILEGDEYLTSALNPVPKFHIYKPHLAMLTGIAWDHINVFPTFDIYVQQFEIFLSHLPNGATLAYFKHDEHLAALAQKYTNLNLQPYDTHPHLIENGQTYLLVNDKKIPVHIFGEHNLQNLSGVKILANAQGISDDDFYMAVSSFTGTARRLEKIYEKEDYVVYRDFAHSPSKVLATTEAVKKQFPNRTLIACVELHTYSSLNKEFLSEYKGVLDTADIKVVFFNQHTFEIKKMSPLTDEDIYAFFGNDTLILHDAKSLEAYIQSKPHQQTCLLLMSSGSFDGLDLEGLKR